MVGDIFQPTHLLFVLVVALLVLGPKRLPEVGRTLGSGIRDFRAAINGEHTDAKDDEPEELDTHAWTTEPEVEDGNAEPENDHEFAHAQAETTPEQHEFAHDTTSTATGAQAGSSDHEPAPATERPASPQD
jgi:sec-independent protein translocase protein TatA